MRRRNRVVRNIAAIAGGVGAGIIASRLLPPILASVNGRARARFFHEDPFERLVRDHRELDSTLTEMERLSGASSARRGRLYLSLKRRLAKHAMAEEDVVYPLLQDSAQEGKETRHLYDDHADMKIRLFELENLIRSNADWTNEVRSLHELIRNHVRDEEDNQFPKLRRMLSERKTRALTGQIRREEAMVL